MAPPMNLGYPDAITWLGSHDGDFAVKSAYGLISSDMLLPADPLFRLIWKFDVMERIRVFLWHVIVDALPTSFFRFSRHITDDPSCTRCNMNMHETTSHVFRDCTTASCFWTRLVDAETYLHFFIANLRSWVHWNLDPHNPIDGLYWARLFASAIHYL